MSILAGRKWYVAALLLILGAIAAQLIGQYHTGRGVMAIARAAAVPAEWLQVRQIASWHVQRARQWGFTCFGLFALAAASWLISFSRREPGPQGLLMVRHVLFLLMLLLIV
jgi:hypothetical protein